MLLAIGSLILIVIVVIFPAQYYEEIRAVYNAEDNAQVYSIGKLDSSGHVHDRSMAFVFGSTVSYNYLESFKCKAAIEALSKVGGFKGSIYLLASDEQCYNQDELRKSSQNSNVHVINIKKDYQKIMDSHPDPSEILSEKDMEVAIPAGSPRYQKAMTVKTMLLDYINDSRIDTVLWYDCDVLAVRPGCVADMVKNKPKITKEDPIHVKKFPLVATIAASPQHSREALLKWRKTIIAVNEYGKEWMGTKGHGVPDSFSFRWDFKDIFRKSNNSILHPIFHDRFIRREDVLSDYCMVHLSNGRCREERGFGSRHVNNVVKALNLEATAGRRWCGGSLRDALKKNAIELKWCSGPKYWWF
jgi:hypothetical protein